MRQSSFTVSLHPHPDFPAAAVRSLQVQGEWLETGGLQLEYCLEGALEALLVPGSGALLDPERLWAHSCFEVFLAGEGGDPGYREYNFSPSGQWAGYAFSAYRERQAGPALPPPDLAWQRTVAALRLRVVLPAAALPGTSLHLGLTTVLELADGRLSYWALHHPCDCPDFHHRGGFTLTLEQP